MSCLSKGMGIKLGNVQSDSHINLPALGSHGDIARLD